MNIRRLVLVLGAVAATFVATSPARAQGQDTGGSCIPASQRAGRAFGCFIIAAQQVGQLDDKVSFWHVETFPTRQAAERARAARGAVVETFGKVWLLTIAEAGWRSPGGAHVAEIGPLPIASGISYTAQYMEAIFRPGMKSTVHRHSGPEAWYTVSGETCLETPQGRMVGRAGGSYVVVPGGPPMELTATGSETREALVLILHDSGQPPTSPATDWTPKGLCRGADAMPSRVAQQGLPALRAGTDLLTMDAQVVAAVGKPMPDLTPDRFEVRIDGRLRRVLLAEFLHADGGAITRNPRPVRTDPACVFGFERSGQGTNAHYRLGIEPLDTDKTKIKHRSVRIKDRALAIKRWAWRGRAPAPSSPGDAR
jgi:quercetin dioxygenase-like cupin family protein